MFAGKVRSRKLLFNLIAIVLCVIFVCSTVTALTALSTSSENSKITVNQSDILPEGYISAEQAIQIATPYINQYTIENNRSVNSIKATFYSSSPEATDRGGWAIEAAFESIPCSGFPTGNFVNGYPAEQYWIHGYTVCVWADTGEIRSLSIIGAM
jgi:hypothetical protein